MSCFVFLSPLFLIYYAIFRGLEKGKEKRIMRNFLDVTNLICGGLKPPYLRKPYIRHFFEENKQHIGSKPSYLL